VLATERAIRDTTDTNIGPVLQDKAGISGGSEASVDKASLQLIFAAIGAGQVSDLRELLKQTQGQEIDPSGQLIPFTLRSGLSTSLKHEITALLLDFAVPCNTSD